MKLNTRVELTRGETIEITSTSKIVDITANWGFGKTDVVACVYHADETAALSIADHICAIPEMVSAIDAFNSMKNHTPLSMDNYNQMEDNLNELMLKAYNKINK